MGVVLAGRLGGGWVGFPWEHVPVCVCVFLACVTWSPCSLRWLSLWSWTTWASRRREAGTLGVSERGMWSVARHGAKNHALLVCPFPGSRLAPDTGRMRTKTLAPPRAEGTDVGLDGCLVGGVLLASHLTASCLGL